MGYIRIKLKNLIMLVIGVLLVAIAFVYLQSYSLLMLGRINEISKNWDKASVYYDRVADSSQINTIKVKATKSKLEMFLKNRDFQYFKKVVITGASSSSNGAVVSPYSIDYINRQYLELKQSAKHDDVFAEYEIEVALMNYFAGFGEKALEIFNSIGYIKNGELQQLRDLHLSAIYMSLGDMEKAYSFIEAFASNGGNNSFSENKIGISNNKYRPIAENLLTYYYLMTGDFENFNNTNVYNSSWEKSSETNNRGVYRDREIYKIESPLIKPFTEIGYILRSCSEIVWKMSQSNLDVDNSENDNSISGKVTMDGKPLPYTMVFLKENKYKYMMGSILGAGDGVIAIAITDGQGMYNINNIPAGLYGIGISADWHRINGRTVIMDKEFNIRIYDPYSKSIKNNEDSINNEVNDNEVINITKNIYLYDTKDMVKVNTIDENLYMFELNPPALETETADMVEYYTISMGELIVNEENEQIYYDSFRSGEIVAFPYILDVEKERVNGFYTSFSYSDKGVDPYTIIGAFYHTGDYAYTMYAHDKKGNIVYESKGIMPNRKHETVFVKGNEWNEADKLLLEGNFEKALAEYEMKVEDDSNDLHSAKVLARIYYNGWKYNKDSFGLDGKNYDKAQKYLELLDSKIRGNTAIKSTLADVFVKKGNYDKAASLYLELSEIELYFNYNLASIYSYKGMFKEAAQCLEKFHASTGRGIDYLLMIQILHDEDEKLLDTAARYDSEFYYAEYEKVLKEYLNINKSNYEEFFDAIGREDISGAEEILEKREDDLALLYKGIMMCMKRAGMEYEERESGYTELYNKVRNQNIKELMKYLGKAWLNTGFGDF